MFFDKRTTKFLMKLRYKNAYCLPPCPEFDSDLKMGNLSPFSPLLGLTTKRK